MTTSIDPNNIDPDEMDAYLSGAPNSTLDTMRLNFPEFDARVQRTRATLDKLRSALNRFDCPSPEQLRDYQFNDLEDDERRKIALHMQTCATCQRELAALGTNHVGLTPMPQREVKPERKGFLDSLKDAVDVLVAHPLPMMTTPQRRSSGNTPAEARYGVAGKPWEITLSIEENPISGFVISGQVEEAEMTEDADDHESVAFPSGIALLFQAGQLLATKEIDEVGWFEFVELKPGHYSLWLDTSDSRVEVSNLAVGLKPSK